MNVRELPVKKKVLDKIINKSVKLVGRGALGIRAKDEFSYRGFRVKVVIETEVIREYELPKVVVSSKEAVADE